MSTPNTGIPYVPESTLDPAAGLNLALNVIDALLQTRVLSMALTAPPGSPADGDLYIPATPATGDWLNLEDHLVRYVAEGDFWQSYTPGVQVHLVLNVADGGFYKYLPGSPGGWVLAAGLSDAPSNGLYYARRNGSWEAFIAAITVQNTASPPEQITDVSTIEVGGTLEVQESAPGVALITNELSLYTPESPPSTLVESVREIIIGSNLTLTEAAPGVAQLVATGGAGGSAPLTPDTHPASPNAMDDEFEAASLDSKWAWLAQGTSTANFSNGSLILTSPIEAGLQVRGIEQNHTGPARYRMKGTGVNPNNFNSGGIYFRNSVNGRLLIIAVHRVAQNYGVFYFDSPTVFNSAPVGDTARGVYAQPAGQGWLYCELEDDGTNLIVRFSNTGQEGMFPVIISVTRAAFLGTPDKVGLCAFASSAATPGILYCDWFRRMA